MSPQPDNTTADMTSPQVAPPQSAMQQRDTLTVSADAAQSVTDPPAASPRCSSTSDAIVIADYPPQATLSARPSTQAADQAPQVRIPPFVILLDCRQTGAALQRLEDPQGEHDLVSRANHQQVPQKRAATPTNTLADSRATKASRLNAPAQPQTGRRNAALSTSIGPGGRPMTYQRPSWASAPMSLPAKLPGTASHSTALRAPINVDQQATGAPPVHRAAQTTATRQTGPQQATFGSTQAPPASASASQQNYLQRSYFQPNNLTPSFVGPRQIPADSQFRVPVQYYYGPPPHIFDQIHAHYQGRLEEQERQLTKRHATDMKEKQKEVDAKKFECKLLERDLGTKWKRVTQVQDDLSDMKKELKQALKEVEKAKK